MSAETADTLTIAHEGMAGDIALAVRHRAGAPGKCGAMWLGGFKSDMSGGKATALCDWAGAQDRPSIRFDYSGHGESGGSFSEGTVGRWLAEARAVFEAHAAGPNVLVGSSMGGWLALLLALDLAMNPAKRGHVAGLVLIAPATDMSEELMWKSFPEPVRREVMETGRFLRPSQYDPEPYEITRGLIEEGRRHLLLGGGIDLDLPVRILHGMADPDVPWEHGVRTAEAISGGDVVVTLVKDGDHRLSREKDIARLTGIVAALCTEIESRAQP